MKLLLTSLLIGGFSSTVFAQDKVVLRTGDTLKVAITKTTPESIEFTYPGESLANVQYKNAIDRIIYASGRVEVCSTKTQLQKIESADDWDKVVVTYTETDIKGLTRVAEITKTSLMGGALATGAGTKDAIKKIKKEAAKQGASIIWIADKPNEHTTGYGAGVRITAIAYK